MIDVATGTVDRRIAVGGRPWGIEDPRIYEFFKGVHRVTSYVFVALIALHVLAAVRHLVLRDGIFGRMWPGRTG